jgi:hypothetical protein
MRDGESPKPKKRTIESAEWQNILPFPRPTRMVNQRALLAFIAKQRCVICSAYHCKPVYVTISPQQPLASGDNVIPVCVARHANLPLLVLYQTYPSIHQWLEDHERLDAILKLRRELAKYKMTLRY